MKKLFLTMIVLTKLFCVNAQNVSVNYTRSLSPPNEVIVTNGRIAPQMIEQISLGYSQNLFKSNFNLTLAAVAGLAGPPRKGFDYPPCLECTAKAVKPIPKGSVIGFANPESPSLSLLVGLGYTLPHKAGSGLTFSVNIDGGVAINKDQAQQYTFDGKVVYEIPFEKSQIIIMPSVKMRVALSDRLGINLGGGYSNIGGMNLTSGLSFDTSPKRE